MITIALRKRTLRPVILVLEAGGFIKTKLYAICCCFFSIGEYNLISSNPCTPEYSIQIIYYILYLFKPQGVALEQSKFLNRTCACTKISGKKEILNSQITSFLSYFLHFWSCWCRLWSSQLAAGVSNPQLLCCSGWQK